MEGPSKPDLQFKNNDDGTVTVTYKPTAAGTYKLHLKFTHYHLPGKPYRKGFANKSDFALRWI
jgi:filamin